MNVLVAGSKTYSFRHALLGEAVYDDLLPGRAGPPARPVRRSPRRRRSRHRRRDGPPRAPRRWTSTGPPPPASRPATRPCPSADPTRRPGTTSTRSSCSRTPTAPSASTSTSPRSSSRPPTPTARPATASGGQPARRAHRAAAGRRAGVGSRPAAQQLRALALHHRDDARPDRGHQPGGRARAGGREPAAGQGAGDPCPGPRRHRSCLDEAENAATEALALAERLRDAGARLRGGHHAEQPPVQARRRHRQRRRAPRSPGRGRPARSPPARSPPSCARCSCSAAPTRRRRSGTRRRGGSPPPSTGASRSACRGRRTPSRRGGSSAGSATPRATGTLLSTWSRSPTTRAVR